MKINLEKTLYILFTLGLFFFSFNQTEVMPFMGEYVRESGAIFLFIGFMIMMIEIIIKGKVNFPIKNKLFHFLIVFYLITFFSVIVNISTVSENYFKKTTGISRFIRQMISLSIPILVFLPFFWRVIKDWTTKEIFIKIRTIFLYTLLFAGFYGAFEILFSYFHFYPAKYVLEFIGLIFPFIDPYYHSEGRISGFAYEPPFFAIYLITVSGWMFSYILTEKNVIRKITPTLIIIVLTFFSGSRTGLLVIFFLLGIFILYLYKRNLYRNVIHNGVILLSLSSVLIFTLNSDKLIYSINEKFESLNFVDNLKNNVSNKTRFGMQAASIEVFKENPVFGVGFGQQTYHARHHYPRWATVNNWEFEELYKNKLESSFPPGYNIFTRLLAETGIIGIISWITLLVYSIYILLKYYKNTNDEYTKFLCISIFISLIGLYINWLQTDTFRMYGVWIYFAILMKLDTTKFNLKNDTEYTNNTTL